MFLHCSWEEDQTTIGLHITQAQKGKHTMVEPLRKRPPPIPLSIHPLIVMTTTKFIIYTIRLGPQNLEQILLATTLDQGAKCHRLGENIMLLPHSCELRIKFYAVVLSNSQRSHEYENNLLLALLS